MHFAILLLEKLIGELGFSLDSWWRLWSLARSDWCSSCRFFTFDYFHWLRFYKNSIKSFIGLLLYFKVVLSFMISIILPCWFIELDPDILIGLSFNFTNEAYHSFLLWDFLGVYDYLLTYLELAVHLNQSNIMRKNIETRT